MIVTQITNHVQQALNRLLQQYQGRPNITGLLTALITQCQLLENAIYPIDQYRQLAYAYGEQLDNIGTVIGLERNGLPDNEYFVLLLGTIAENNSDTTAPTMLNIVQTIFQSSNVFIKTPNSGGSGPFGMTMNANVAFGVGSPVTPATLNVQLEQIVLASLAAGVALFYISRFNSAGAFSTAGPQSWCRGCSDLLNPQPTDGVIGSLIFSTTTS
jgi:hypothetical protein